MKVLIGTFATSMQNLLNVLLPIPQNPACYTFVLSDSDPSATSAGCLLWESRPALPLCTYLQYCFHANSSQVLSSILRSQQKGCLSVCLFIYLIYKSCLSSPAGEPRVGYNTYKIHRYYVSIYQCNHLCSTASCSYAILEPEPLIYTLVASRGNSELQIIGGIHCNELWQ